MSPKYLHQHEEFKELISITARDQGINEPSLVEKDYWIMHVLHGLKKQGFEFQLKGGTSLSKGFGIINRFSEDIDIKIDPPSGQEVKTGKNQNNPSQIESRKKYFEWLAKEISISDIVKIERDQEFDDEKFRGAGIRLNYDSHFETVSGLKPGILLEVGFDQYIWRNFRNLDLQHTSHSWYRGYLGLDFRLYSHPKHRRFHCVQ